MKAALGSGAAVTKSAGARHYLPWRSPVEDRDVAHFWTNTNICRCTEPAKAHKKIHANIAILNRDVIVVTPYSIAK